MSAATQAINNAQGIGVTNEREISPMDLTLDQLNQLKSQHEVISIHCVLLMPINQYT